MFTRDEETASVVVGLTCECDNVDECPEMKKCQKTVDGVGAWEVIDKII